MLRKRCLQLSTLLVLGTALASSPVLAQGQGNQPMQGHPMQGHPGGAMQPNMAKSPSSHAYMQSMRTMDQSMRSTPMTGDADRDFAAMMMAHHQGAIDMARVELEHGKDPDLKAMAQAMIDEQTKEIKELQAWLDRHPPQATKR